MSTRTRQDWVLWAQLGCALVATAHAEYVLVTALAQHWAVAVAVTGALDLYVVRALQKRKDVLPAVLVMVAANVTSILLSHGVLAVHWAVLAAVGALAPLLVWRGHVLRVHSDTASAPVLEAPGAVSTPGASALDPQPLTAPVDLQWFDQTPTWMQDEYPASAPPPCALSEPFLRDLDHKCGECGNRWGSHLGVLKKRAEHAAKYPDHATSAAYLAEGLPVDWYPSAPTHLHSVPDLPALPPEYVTSAQPLSDSDAAYLRSAHEYISECARSEVVPSVRGLMKHAAIGQARAGRLLDHLEAKEET